MLNAAIESTIIYFCDFSLSLDFSGLELDVFGFDGYAHKRKQIQRRFDSFLVYSVLQLVPSLNTQLGFKLL